jgi:hypothetical protein
VKQLIYSDDDKEQIRAGLDAISAKYKRSLRDEGYYVRMTEWHEGFQVAAFKKTDVRKCYVSAWSTYENPAWEEVFLWAVKERENGNQGTV